MRKFSRVVPSGTKAQYYDDAAMRASASMISAELLEREHINDAYEALQSLRDGAYRADLGRCMILYISMAVATRMQTWKCCCRFHLGSTLTALLLCL